MRPSNPINYRQHFTTLTGHELKYAPKELYWEGNLNLLDQGTKISIVGSRKASEEGIATTEAICKELVENGITIVSGLAEGIDTIAHQTAIKNGGKTIAVLGTPLNITFPKENTSLLAKIKKEHLAISQFNPNTPVRKANFPMRNRTMALISDATIIIEASEKSGTIHQGWEAIRLGRILFILQPILDNPSVAWAHEMISYGAHVLSADSLADALELVVNLSPSTEALREAM